MFDSEYSMEFSAETNLESIVHVEPSISFENSMSRHTSANLGIDGDLHGVAFHLSLCDGEITLYEFTATYTVLAELNSASPESYCSWFNILLVDFMNDFRSREKNLDLSVWAQLNEYFSNVRTYLPSHFEMQLKTYYGLS